MAIVGILIALLIPAPCSGSARPASAGQLRQQFEDSLGLGLHQFHNNFKMFPSNGGWDGKQTIPSAGGTPFTPETFDFTTNQGYKFGVGDPLLGPQQQTGSWGYAILAVARAGTDVSSARLANRRAGIHLSGPPPGGRHAVRR